MVSSFLNMGHLLKELNQTILTPIPKGDSQSNFKDFRPICLLIVTYKVISKTLANRLPSIIGEVISPFQSAFAKGQNISDNILVAHELLRHIKKTRKERPIGQPLRLISSRPMTKFLGNLRWRLCLIWDSIVIGFKLFRNAFLQLLLRFK